MTAPIIDVMEQQELEPEERTKLLEGATPEVLAIADALRSPNRPIADPEIKEAVESIRRWAQETKLSEEHESSAP